MVIDLPESEQSSLGTEPPELQLQLQMVGLCSADNGADSLLRLHPLFPKTWDLKSLIEFASKTLRSCCLKRKVMVIDLPESEQSSLGTEPPELQLQLQIVG